MCKFSNSYEISCALNSKQIVEVFPNLLIRYYKTGNRDFNKDSFIFYQ